MMYVLVDLGTCSQVLFMTKQCEYLIIYKGVGCPVGTQKRNMLYGLSYSSIPNASCIVHQQKTTVLTITYSFNNMSMPYRIVHKHSQGM